MPTWLQWCLIGLAGGLGALSRFGVSELCKTFWNGTFPLGTLLVNLAGCFLLGVVVGLSSERLSDQTKSIVGTGFLGALTTFSTFGVETMKAIDEGKHLVAISNVGINVIAGLVLAAFGMAVGRWISQSARS